MTTYCLETLISGTFFTNRSIFYCNLVNNKLVWACISYLSFLLWVILCFVNVRGTVPNLPVFILWRLHCCLIFFTNYMYVKERSKRGNSVRTVQEGIGMSVNI